MPHPTSKNRRRLAVGLLVLASAGGLVACSPGDGTDGSASVEITMTIWGGDTDKSTMEQRLALAKEKYPDITVKLNLIAEDYDTKVQTMFAGGTAPDIMETAEGVNVYSSKGQLEDLTPYFQAEGVDPVESFGQGSVNTYSTDGKLWAAPDRSGAAVVYYNKDLFDQAGVSYPTADWDWQTFRDAARRLTVKDGDTTTVWGYAAGDWWPWYMSWIYQNGGRILDDSGQPVANSAENIEALTFYNDMVFTDHSAPSPLDYADAGLDNGSPDPLFAQGKLAMEVTGFWNIASLKDSGLNWDIAPMWHGQDKAVPAFSNALAVASSSKNKEAAAKIVTFLTSAAGQKPIAETGLDVPANLQAVADPSFQNPAWNTAGVDLSAFTSSAADVYAPPFVPEWNKIQSAFTDGLADTWTDQQSVKDGLDKVQATLEDIFG
ncbi:MAG: sugar ABC transporter substrate-binding protein [Propionibacteriaceae bacterium]|jgi:multiple sugar transport system substrate-binding protein|nr:sugar ABC transporter substrate-binding protein [Propionibacteriaceae bacterium]